MRIFIAVLLFLTVTALSHSQSPLRVPPFLNGYLDISVKDKFTGFYDPTGKMRLEEIRTKDFVPLDSLQYPKETLRNNDCRIWLQCRTDSQSLAGADSTHLYWHFNLRHTLIEGFRVGSNGVVEHFKWGKDPAGQKLPTLFLVPFEQSGEIATSWYFSIQPFPFRINNFSPRLLSIKGWWNRAAIQYHDTRLGLNITIALTGIILFISLFTFTQWALYRLPVFLYYACFLVSSLANFYRYENEFAIPVTKLTAFLNTQGDFITIYLGLAFYFLFLNTFLKLQWRMPRLYQLTNWTAKVSVFLLIVHFIIYYIFNRHDWAISIFHLRFVLISVCIFVLLAITYKRPPFYIFISCGGLAVSVGAIIWLISGNRLEHGQAPIPYASLAFYWGVMIETLFFISGLGYQFKISEVAKRKAQQHLLNERERITRDLHDDVGSTLNSLAVLSELAGRQSNTLPAEVVKTLATIQYTARDTVQRISDIVWSVNPNIETIGDLVARMRSFTFSLFSGTDTRVRFSVPENLESLIISADKRWQLYLIFKEAVNNTSKYAQATQLKVTLKEQNGKMHLSIQDNGQGFDPEQTHTGNGLRTMQERTHSVGGSITLGSVVGQGTVVEMSWLL